MIEINELEKLFDRCKDNDEMDYISNPLWELICHCRINPKFVVSPQVIENYKSQISNFEKEF